MLPARSMLRASGVPRSGCRPRTSLIRLGRCGLEKNLSSRTRSQSLKSISATSTSGGRPLTTVSSASLASAMRDDAPANGSRMLPEPSTMTTTSGSSPGATLSWQAERGGAFGVAGGGGAGGGTTAACWSGGAALGGDGLVTTLAGGTTGFGGFGLGSATGGSGAGGGGGASVTLGSSGGCTGAGAGGGAIGLHSASLSSRAWVRRASSARSSFSFSCSGPTGSAAGGDGGAASSKISGGSGCNARHTSHASSSNSSSGNSQASQLRCSTGAAIAATLTPAAAGADAAGGTALDASGGTSGGSAGGSRAAPPVGSAAADRRRHGRARRRSRRLGHHLRGGSMAPTHQHRLAIDRMERIVGRIEHRQLEHVPDQLGRIAFVLHLLGELADLGDQLARQSLDRPALLFGKIGQPADLARAAGRREPGDAVVVGIDLGAAEEQSVLAAEAVAEDRSQLPVHRHHRLVVHLQATEAGADRRRYTDVRHSDPIRPSLRSAILLSPGHRGRLPVNPASRSGNTTLGLGCAGK